MTENPKFDHSHYDNGEFKGQSEDQDKGGGKGNIVTNPPIIGDSDFLSPVVKEGEDIREDVEVGKENAGKKESEADGKGRPEGSALLSFQPGQDKLKDEVENKGESDDDSGKEGQLHREHECFRRLKGTHQTQIPFLIETGGGIGLKKKECGGAGISFVLGKGFQETFAFFFRKFFGCPIEHCGFGQGALFGVIDG